MTEPADFERDEQLLPGLEPARRGDSALVLSVRRSLAAFHDEGLFIERHAMLGQLMLDLAVVVDAGRAQGRASAAAMAAAQLLAAYQLLLPVTEEGGDPDGWDVLADDLRSAAARTLAELERRGTAVRDSPEPGRLD